jgi:hypothetical protein
MKELRDWLKEGDPVANEPPLSDADVQRMRQSIVSASDSPQPFFADWARGSWAAATVMVSLTIAAGVNRWFTPLPETRRPNAPAVSAVAAPAPGERRQVQLIAPGGTRVIWIFNADFKP